MIIITTELDRVGKQPVYMQIYSILLTEIQNGAYDETGMLPSEKELCGRFGVERNTVRKALQILVNEGRVSKKPGFGTVLTGDGGDPAGSAAPAESELIRKNVLLVTYADYFHDNGEYFHFKLVNGFEKSMSEMGYNLIFKSVDIDAGIREIIQHTLPVAIIYDSYMHDDLYREGLETGVPCISINHYTPLMTSVVSNNFDGAYKVAKMLSQAGHKRIAVITGKRNYQTNIERMSGLQKLYLKEDAVTNEMLVLDGDWLFSSGVKAGEQILSMPATKRPTAVFAFNDDMAFGCYSCFERAGIRVPEDISIVGFDKSDRYHYIFPGITTVDVNVSAMIEYTCWILSEHLNGTAPRYNTKIQMDTTLCDNGTIRTLI
ncbi:MAG: GntR family transcriptional regulator [Clostridia bacterium]|nr:GntR family transcriptional regulator [Clostridia bacterium]